MEAPEFGTVEEKTAAEILRKNRWSQAVTCVYCSSKVVKNGLREDGVQQYRCPGCDKSFNDRTDTVFSKTQMKISECFYAVKAARSGESIRTISRDLGRSWKTVDSFVKAFERSFTPADMAREFLDRTRDNVDYSRFGCGNLFQSTAENNHLQF